MNNITIELCREDRNRIDTLIAVGLELAKKNIYDVQPVAPAETHQLTPDEMPAHSQTLPETRQEAAGAASAPAAESAHPVDSVTPWGEPVSEAAPVEPVREVTAAELLALVQKLAAPGSGKRDKAKAIVQSYGAKVSDVPADKRAECMDKLVALDQEVAG